MDEPPPAPAFDLDRALSGLAGRKSVLIYTHDNPDPDSLAAALSLERLLSRELVNYEAGTRARIVFQRRPEGDVAMNVDLAPPGKDFVPWLVSALKKK